MKISIKDSASGETMNCEAMPTQNEKEEGWSILLPTGSSIFITRQLYPLLIM